MTKHAIHNIDSSARAPWEGLTTWNGTFATALGRAGAVYTKAWLEWQQELVRFAGTRLEDDRLVQESLSECRDLGAMTKAQQDWALKAASDYFEEATRLAQIASRFALIACEAGRGGGQESKAAK